MLQHNHEQQPTLKRNNALSFVSLQREAAVGGKLAPIPTKFYTFSGASAPMFCAKSPVFASQVEQMVRAHLVKLAIDHRFDRVWPHFAGG
jgi:hypothetical protein